MMNCPVSPRLQLLRYALAGPLVVAAALAYSAAHAQPAPNPAPPVNDSFAVAKPDEAPLDLTSAVAEKEPRAPGIATRTELPLAVTIKKVRYRAPSTIPSRAHTASSQVTEVTAASAPLRGPKPGLKPFKGTARSYYVDGQVVDEVAAMAVKDIASIHVLKGETAKQFLGYDGDARAVVAITTKGKMGSPEVVEFNNKIQQATPLKGMVQAAPAKKVAPADSTEKPVSPMYLGSAGLAYITKNYPDARLVGVDQIRPASGGAPRYRATIAIGRRPGYITFGERGEFISESYSK